MATAETAGGDGSRQAQGTLSRRAVLGWFFLLSCVGLYVRVAGTYGFAFSGDEALHLNVARGHSLADVLRYARYEAHPPLFYVLLHYWMQISDAPSFLRGLPLLLNMTLIPLYYCIGRKLGGPLSGLSCAALAGLGYGCVIQACVLRQYSVLLPSISLNFMCWLHWRDARGKAALAGYFVSGLLAALSHFSAVFYFIAIGVFETVALFRRKGPLCIVIEWLMANLVIAVLILFLYYLWEPTLSFLRLHDQGVLFNEPASGPQLILRAFGAPFIEAFYIYLFIPLLPFLFCYALSSGFASPLRAALYPYILLCAVACGLSIVLYATGIYPIAGTRHNLWMLPLLLPVMGGMLADVLERVRIHVGHWPVKIAVIVVLASAAVDMTAKLAQEDEYGAWQHKPWQAITGVLERLGPRDILIVDKPGGNLLANLYPYRSDAAFMNGGEPALVAYHNTHILIGPDYFSVYNHAALQEALRKAQANHLLDQVDRLVFLKLWPDYPLYDLVTCEDVAKQTLYPELQSALPLTRERFPPGGLAVIAIDKQVFLDQVLAPSANAHHCLDEKHDKTTGFYFSATARQESH
jgi:hypothetical protein